MRTLLVIAIAGAAAQLVDGGIGMGFGATSTSLLLLLAGLGPAQASAVVHTAEVGTTLVSGLSHWHFNNVNWSVVLRLGVPGAIASFAGATVLSTISLEAATPVTSAILVLIGANLVWRFSRRQVRVRHTGQRHSTWFLGGLGLVGGLVDASGGGGWGPVTTSTLMGIGREEPRRIVGTVSASEFLVSLGATLGFAVGLWDDLTANAAAVGALLIGGMLTAPVAAWLVNRLNPVALGCMVGAAIVALNIDGLVPGTPAWVIIALLVTGAALSARAVYRLRRGTAVAIAEQQPSGRKDLTSPLPHR